MPSEPSSGKRTEAGLAGPALGDQLEALARETTPQSARRLLERAFAALEPRHALLSTGLGMEGCALLDLVAPLDLPLRIVFLDTGFHFDETLELWERLARRYANLAFESIEPESTPAEQAVAEGDELWLRRPDRCCHLRKIEPLGRRLEGADLWISAIGRSQSETRRSEPVLAATSRFGVAKLSPLLHWRRAEIWRYVQEHDVPWNALHERGYPSISCRHCTRPVPGLGPGEYSRAGRWSGTSKTECGLHILSAEEPPARSSPPSETSADLAPKNTEEPVRRGAPRDD